MENLKIRDNNHSSVRNLLTGTLLVGALSLLPASCGKATQKDINEQREKIELLSFNIENYINARKEVVKEYNKILAYPKTESNKYEIDNHLSLLEESIIEYDKKIQDLIEDKIDAEKSLNKKIGSRGTTGIHTPADPNKRDYLLKIN